MKFCQSSLRQLREYFAVLARQRAVGILHSGVFDSQAWDLLFAISHRLHAYLHLEALGTCKRFIIHSDQPLRRVKLNIHLEMAEVRSFNSV
jgi:hypothetical protein